MFINNEPFKNAKDIIKGKNSIIYEEIGGAAKVVVKFKPKNGDNTAPLIITVFIENLADVLRKYNDLEVESIDIGKAIEYAVINNKDSVITDILKKYSVENYLQSNKRILQIQTGGYYYTDVADVKDNTITINSECNLGKDKTYGPYANVYTPQYNNLDIYAYLFGVNKLNASHITGVAIPTLQQNSITFTPPEKPKVDGIIYNGKNINQNLMNKLVNGGNVVLFGYGFSGSGKTYTLLEGQRYKSIDKILQELANNNTFTDEDKKLINNYLQTLQPASRKAGVDNTTPNKETEYVKLIQKENIKTAIIESIKNQQYDPSLLEQFIKENTDEINSVEFLEIYPLGVGANGEVKIFCDSEDNKKYSNSKAVLDTDSVTTKRLFEKITNSDNITFDLIDARIKQIEKYRRAHLRILSTPNNDNSSRSFFQITLTLIKGNKLVFFDMPGTENTVRIKQELLGNETFNAISSIIPTEILETAVENVDYMKQLKEKDKLIAFKLSKSVTNDDTTYMIPFKSILGTFTNIGNIIGASGRLKPEYIGKVVEQLCLFFNKRTEDKFTDLPTDTTIKIPQDEQIKKIVRHFLKTVILKGYNDNKDDTIKFDYFTLSKTEGTNKTPLLLTDDDKINITKVFGLGFEPQGPLNWVETTESNFGIFGNNDDPKQSESKRTANNRLMYDFRDLLYDKKTITQADRNYHFSYTKKDNHCELIRYFLIIMNTVLCNLSNTKETYLIGMDFYKVMLIFVYKYVKFIVDQGAAIVSNLEHLKFFFLSNTNNIDSYNNSANANKVLPYNYNYTYEDGTYKPAPAPAPAPASASAPAKNNYTILDNEITYTKPTTIGKDKLDQNITMDEKINIGEMKKYKLLSILQNLANQNPELDNLIESKKNMINLFQSPQNKIQEKSLFVMFTNIKIFTDKKNTNGDEINNTKFIDLDASIKENLCTAEFDTLEFADSISSTTQGKTKPIMTKGGSLNRYNYKTSKFNLKTFTQYNRNRNNKTYKAITLKKRKDNNHIRGKTLFVRRSKKYFN
jgi:hypothetical protein